MNANSIQPSTLGTAGAWQPKANHAYGVDPYRPQRYSLRQARYHALAEDMNRLAREAAARGEKLRVLDVGFGTGILVRYLEPGGQLDHMTLSGADYKDNGDGVYRRDAYGQIFLGDLTDGYPEIPSESYDVIVCEQVLEHLPRIEAAIGFFQRVLRPGGTLFVGVPIFVPPLVLGRRYIVPVLDRVTRRKRSRAHLQAFSLGNFVGAMRRHSELRLEKVRGFRIISGGLLKSLENHRWWWAFNRWLGEQVPSLCIEIQAVMTKPIA
jgi:2-polyprenyl-3-methyl-5-hydroxy-6-metoxy-1,4-benzoquinol methylase